MRRVYLAQVNYQYGKNTFLPYSVGRLWAFAQNTPLIKAEYELAELIFLREPIDDVIRRMRAPDVFGGSCYIWNWEYTTALAKRINERWPECLIVLGGPQVPNKADGFFDQNPYVDVIVQGEGEQAFCDILIDRACGVELNRNIRKTKRIDGLEILPSPYLAGVFDRLIDLPYDFHASQETNRGCPYKCTFCDWGSATMSKVRAFPQHVIENEIEWFSLHEIELVYNCDANWGMLPQDLATTGMLVSSKEKTGFPQQFRAAYAKKMTPRVRKIAQLLSDSEMSKGVTLSVQSMNERTLDLVKRKNTSLDDIATLVKEFRGDGVPTYTEVILGLPGETYESFADGLDKLMDAGQHESINIYPAIRLHNSEMGDLDHMEEHGIETVRMPMLLLHGSINDDECREYYEIVVQTKDMPHKDWRRAYILGWAVQAFHCLGLTRIAAIVCRQHGISYRDFYEGLIDWSWRHELSLMGKEVRRIDWLLGNVLRGKPWDTVVHGAGDITWPPEEATFLRLMKERLAFFYELIRFVASMNWKTEGALRNSGLMVIPGEDFEKYARDVVWYGRKGGDTLNPDWVKSLEAVGGENESVSSSTPAVY